MRQVITYNNKNWTLPGQEPVPVGYAGLKFTSTGASTIGLSNFNSPDVKYSLDNGSTWTLWDYSTISLSDGETICFKGNNPNGWGQRTSSYSGDGNKFVMSGSLIVSGNVMSLIDNGVCNTLIIPSEYCFYRLFYESTALTSAEHLLLPATTLTIHCYTGMLYHCSSLTSAPSILPATTLANKCYFEMFYYCSSLTSAPELPATTLANDCYYDMFSGCSNLNYIKCLATSGINTNNSTTDWVKRVASSGTFVKDSNATWPTGNNGIPSGWTVQDA